MASLRGDASDTTPIAFAALVLLRVSIAAAGQSWHPPAAEERCPSKWGAQDERGAANHVTPESVAKAAKLIRTGEVIELGRVLSSDMPLSPVFARGVLVDIAGLKGIEMLAVDYEIGVADIEAALAREHLTLQAGDAVLVHTGWGRLWGVDNAKYATSSPGIGVAAAEWLAKQNVLLIGGDTAPVEILPNPDKQLDLPVHQIALVVNGIFLLENLKLDQLAEKGVYEFAFMAEPLKIRGGTGSTVAPVAIH